MNMFSLTSANGPETVRDECRKTYHCVLFTALALAALLAIPVHVSADVIPLEATIDGAQANAGAGTGSPGTGLATMTFDTGNPFGKEPSRIHSEFTPASLVQE